jgi:hypothetical protein
MTGLGSTLQRLTTARCNSSRLNAFWSYLGSFGDDFFGDDMFSDDDESWLNDCANQRN